MGSSVSVLQVQTRGHLTAARSRRYLMKYNCAWKLNGMGRGIERVTTTTPPSCIWIRDLTFTKDAPESHIPVTDR